MFTSWAFLRIHGDHTPLKPLFCRGDQFRVIKVNIVIVGYCLEK